MGTLNEDLTAIKEVEDTIIANKVANFAYTDEAYKKNDANGVIKYNVNNAQNIPTADPSVLKVNNTVLSQGYRAQASSITRMLMNHFLGRLSYNVNKVNDGFSNLVATLIKHRGTANGFATLDENGRVPYSQLPESAVGDVKTVNNISPENGNIPLTGENIPVSSTDPTLLSAPLTTDRYANSSVTTEKIADNAVTNAKIKDPISVAKGGTGQSTAKGAQYQLLNDMNEESSDIADSSTFIGLYPASSASVSTGAVYKRKASTVWSYIQSKISSVLGLTATQFNGTSEKAISDASGNNIKNTYATKKETLYKYETPITMIDLGYLKGEEVNIHDFWLNLANRYSQNEGIINFQWKDAGSAYVKDSSGNKAFINGGYLIYKSTGSPNVPWNEFTVIYINSESDIYTLNATVTDNAQKYISSVKKINQSLATTSANGLMSSSDKSKLDNTNSNIITCSTAAGTVAKTVSVTGFTLETGACIRVLFTNGNSVARPTLNVNNTGAKEIVVPNTGSVKTLTSTYGSPTTGAYLWANNTILELYYNGSYWVAINNPIIAQKTTCTDGTTADKPAYSCRLDGYKEIYGSIFLGDVTVNSGSKQTFLLPMTMGSSAYNASIALRQNNLSLLGGDAELSYYGDTTSLTINMWNGNKSDPINDAVLTWIIKGY